MMASATLLTNPSAETRIFRLSPMLREPRPNVIESDDGFSVEVLGSASCQLGSRPRGLIRFRKPPSLRDQEIARPYPRAVACHCDLLRCSAYQRCAPLRRPRRRLLQQRTSAAILRPLKLQLDTLPDPVFLGVRPQRRRYPGS